MAVSLEDVFGSHVLLWNTAKSSDGGCKYLTQSPKLATTVNPYNVGSTKTVSQAGKRSKGTETDTVLSDSSDSHCIAVSCSGLAVNCGLVRVTKSNAKMQLCSQLSKKDQLFCSRNGV